MISINGNNILSAYTGGIPVQAIYCYGNKVWPTTEPELSYYYMSWTPTNLSTGTFTINTYVYNFNEYNGYFGWSGQNSFISGMFSSLSCDYFETNILSLDSGVFGVKNSSDPLNVFVPVISLPECKSISSYAFGWNQVLQSVNLPECTYVGYGAFQYCYSLQYVNLPKCTSLLSNTFYKCDSLQSVDLPECSKVRKSVFARCSSLQSVNLPECTYVDYGAFQNCISLLSVSLPLCSLVATYGFQSCSSLQSIELPLCKEVGAYAFMSCSSLQSISLPLCRNIGVECFDCCPLQSIFLPVCKYIGDMAFRDCSTLTEVTLLYNSVCSLGGSLVFQSTPIASGTGYIYVPSSLVSAYQSASGWSAFSSQIFAIPS